MAFRIYLSPPDVASAEREALLSAFDSGWIAPVGPSLDLFEQKLQAFTSQHALCVNSGTAALHLALLAAGVLEGDNVLVSNLTFAASVFPILYLKANPILVASNPETWNADASYAEEWLKTKKAKAAIITDLYGNPADLNLWRILADAHDFMLIEDAAEALGSTVGNEPIGTYAHLTALSFNGNKIITTSGGGALLAHNAATIAHARNQSTQSKLPVIWYEHEEIGYNYRMSNLLAALGAAQMDTLAEKVSKRRQLFANYQSQLPELGYQKELPLHHSNRWLSTFILPPRLNPIEICQFFATHSIETRPLWKPMHLQPFCQSFPTIGNTEICSRLFAQGICLPSGSNLLPDQQDEIISHLQSQLA